ncbi:MAG: glutamate racemase [Candidatus Marinimicrobia bacterium]|nr:glutamate racemase [Candidatus Neomarinimicrobiota bacterium]|tara:strand:+ start:2329 stop:3129 length:801 start_codon:yes stop_codon:yes gene_type:complete
MNNRPIGVFDSGIGGLTVVDALINRFPNEKIIYFGDTARLPYGNKSSKNIRHFSNQIARWLIDQDCKLIIIACNTASALALNFLRSKFDIPIIGVIKPGALLAIKKSKNNRIGVLGTKATIFSKSYEDTLLKINRDINVFSKACPLFVPLAEEGWVSGDVPKSIAEIYLKEIKKSNIDTIILGCTHYPLIKLVISKILGDEINLIDSGKAAAESVEEILIRKNLKADIRNTPEINCYVTDSAETFIILADKFLTSPINSIKHIELF